MRCSVDKKILVFVIAVLAAFPVFAQIPIESGVEGECFCECFADLDFLDGECFGDCDCILFCDGIDCFADCICLFEEDELDSDAGELFDEIEEDQEDVDETGFLSPQEGTYADYEEIYFIDNETQFTTEVDAVPSWCP